MNVIAAFVIAFWAVTVAQVLAKKPVSALASGVFVVGSLALAVAQLT